MPLTHTTLPRFAFPEDDQAREAFLASRYRVAIHLSCRRTAEGKDPLVLDPDEDIIARNDFWGEFDDERQNGVLIVITGADFYQDRFDTAQERIDAIRDSMKDFVSQTAHATVPVRVCLTLGSKVFWSSTTSD